ncbi:MAG: cobalamin adenosyltransferase [Synergistaceae bacterium]|nr:cobalamin adenosyltransferase [Synergistota bacterium]NLM70387.1 cobalamin adenosyltransferase [Synergistaceae bacterium]
MKLITEGDLRAEIDGRELCSYRVERGTIVTPSARQYLSDRNIELVVGDEETPAERQDPPATGPAPTPEAGRPRFVGPDGGSFTVKPEHLTHISGNRLVTKGHPRIAFRGRMDSLQSRIIELQSRAVELGNQTLAEELDELLDFSRELLASDVTGRQVEDVPLLGLGLDELRSMSHNPKKHFGLGHIRPHYTMGPLCAGLNALRTEIREVELAAFNAYYEGEGVIGRPDVLRALNRLSSVCYVLMYRHLPKGYDREFG